MDSLETLFNELPERVEIIRSRRYDEDGKLKRNIAYGNESLNALDPAVAFVWVGKDWVPERNTGEDEHILKLLEEATSCHKDCRIFAQQKRTNAWLSEHFGSSVISGDGDEYSCLARASTVISVGILPAIFQKRTEQTHIHIATEGELERPRYGRAAFGISCLMSADWILGCDASQLESLCQLYQLCGVYKGKLASIEENAGITIVADLLRHDESNLSFRTLESHRTSLGIFCDGDIGSNAHAYCNHLLSLIDFDTYDVTVIVQSFSRCLPIAQIVDTLDSRARVIVRLGSFSCDMESYIGLQLVIETLLTSDDALEQLRLAPPHVLEGEIERIIPHLTFDTFIYCAKLRKIWLLLANTIQANRKAVFELDWWSTVLLPGSTERRQHNYNAFAMLAEHIFDTAWFPNTEMLEGFTPYVEELSCHHLDTVFSYRRDEIDGNSSTIVAETDLGGLRCLLLGRKEFGVYYQSLVVEYPPQDINCYAMSIKTKDIPHAIARFSSLRANDKAFTDSNLYLFVESKGLNSPTCTIPSMPVFVRLIDIETFEGTGVLHDYVRFFKGYLSYYQDDQTPLCILMSSLGIDVWSFAERDIATCTENALMSSDAYELLCRERLEGLLGR